MIDKQAKPRKSRRQAKPVDVIVKPIPVEAEADIVNRIARFLLDLTEPDEREQPHPLD